MILDVSRLCEAVEAALQEAEERKGDFGVVKWGDLEVVEVERRECLLTDDDTYLAVMIEGGTCEKLRAFVSERLKAAGFSDVGVELTW